MQIEVPDPLQRVIRELRRENAKVRTQRNQYRDEVARLRAELDALKGSTSGTVRA
jgi:hypothetical protein